MTLLIHLNLKKIINGPLDSGIILLEKTRQSKGSVLFKWKAYKNLSIQDNESYQTERDKRSNIQYPFQTQNKLYVQKPKEKKIRTPQGNYHKVFGNIYNKPI